MSGSFTVDPGALTRVAAEIRANAEEYDRIASRLLQEATAMGAAYDTTASREYVDKITGCVNELKAMAEKLKNDAAIIDKQSHNYTTVSENNLEQARKLPG